MAKYKGKNIRVTEDAHQAASDHCGKKLIIGAFVSDAIIEKLQREGCPTLDRQTIMNPQLQGVQTWPVKKETKA